MQWYQIRFNWQAELELDLIGNYILFKLENPTAALNTVRGIRTFIGTLQLFPNRHELSYDQKLADNGVREGYWKNYKVSYIVDDREKIVYIIHILHVSVDSQKKLYETLKIKENIMYGSYIAR